VPANEGFLEFVAEQMAGIGPVTVRKMFGGAGVFRGDRMIGLIADDLLYLRTDLESAPEFEARGMTPFVYSKRGRPVSMSYYRAPEECLEDPEEMMVWAGKAYAAALRAIAAAAAKPVARRQRTGR
jgi:DNA transformation protein